MTGVKSFFKTHYLALIFAFVIGLICITPHIVFKVSLGDEYEGVYLMKTANELEYLSRMQEIIDGHWTLGSVPFFEYKNNSPLTPPSVLDFLFAGSSFLSGVSIASLVITSKFFLPAFLFLLIYFFTQGLIKKKELSRSKINSIAVGAVVVLGYDIIDYRSLLNYFRGTFAPNDFLIWTRPINPILGAILIYLFLLITWKLYKSEKYKFGCIFGAGFVLMLGITSYFFTWGIILSLTGLLFVIGLLKKKYKFAKSLIFVIFSGFILALPYFLNTFSAMKSDIYQYSAMKVGLSEGHDFILNKFSVFSLVLFLGLSLLLWKLSKENVFKKDWWIFSLTLILAGFIALNQQVITGKTVWPFHFVQYTIPLSVTALFVIFHNFSISHRKILRYIWAGSVSFTLLASLFFGIYVQASTFNESFSEYKKKQKYADVFNWLNKNTQKDCVVLSDDDTFLDRGILAFTHCNIRLSGLNGYMVPFERFYNNHLVYVRLRGITSHEIENYIDKNAWQIAVYLYGTEGLQYGGSSPTFLAVKDKLVSDYKKFLEKDLKTELQHYKLDYIITEGGFSDETKSLIKDMELVFSEGGILIYKFE